MGHVQEEERGNSRLYETEERGGGAQKEKGWATGNQKGKKKESFNFSHLPKRKRQEGKEKKKERVRKGKRKKRTPSNYADGKET